MDHLNNSTNKGKGKYLNYEKRLKIEALSKAGLFPHLTNKDLPVKKKSL